MECNGIKDCNEKLEIASDCFVPRNDKILKQVQDKKNPLVQVGFVIYSGSFILNVSMNAVV